MADKTGNDYISGTISDNVEILNSKFRIFDHDKLSKSVAKWLRRRIARSGKIGAKNVYIAISGCRSVVEIAALKFAMGEKNRFSAAI